MDTNVNVALLVLRWALLIGLWVFVAVAIKSMYQLIRPTTAQPRGGRRTGGRRRHDTAPGTLVVQSGPAAGGRFAFRSLAEFTIGRDPTCTVTIPDDAMSGQHAKFMRTTAGWIIEDLESRNGTTVDDHRIDRGGSETVTVGTTITVGRTTVRLEP